MSKLYCLLSSWSEVESSLEKSHKPLTTILPDDEETIQNNETDEEDKVVEKWDCESILSTYSNVYNHPKVITEPVQRNRKVYTQCTCIYTVVALIQVPPSITCTSGY